MKQSPKKTKHEPRLVRTNDGNFYALGTDENGHAKLNPILEIVSEDEPCDVISED